MIVSVWRMVVGAETREMLRDDMRAETESVAVCEGRFMFRLQLYTRLPRAERLLLV